MKICLSSDWQMDSYPGLSEPSEDGGTTRLRDCVDAIRWVARDAKRRGCEVFVMAGDVVERDDVVEVCVIDAVSGLAREIAEMFDKCYAIPGNHDSPLRHPDVTAARLLSGYFDVFTEPTIRGALAFVPWYADETKIKAGVDQVIEWRVSRGGGRYLVSHALIKGMVPDGKGVDIRTFSPKKFNMVLLGDVHEPKVVSEHVRYIGSPMQFDWRDVGGQRGYSILDDETGKVEFIPNEKSAQFYKLKTLADVPKTIRPRDFARIVTEDAKVDKEIRTALYAKCPALRWVETQGVKPAADDELVVRCEMPSGAGYRERLAAYVDYVCDDAERARADELVDIGLRLLRESGAKL